MTDCIFCKIINNELPSDAVLENEYVKVIKDINPKAPLHLVIIAKSEKHIPSIKEVSVSDKELLTAMILAAQQIAAKNSLKGYKLVFNVGREGGQMIDHLHLHLLGGWGSTTHQVNV